MATYSIGPGQTYTTFPALIAALNLAAGDIVDGGGNTFVNAWAPDGSGTNGNPITLRNAVLDVVGTGGTEGVLVNARSYITLDNITILSAVTWGVRTVGATTGLVVKNCNITSPSPGVYLNGTATLTTIQNTVIAGQGNDGNCIYVSATNSNVTIDDVTSNAGGIRVIGGSNLTINRFSRPISHNSHAIQIANLSGTLNITGESTGSTLTMPINGYYGVYLDTVTANGTISNITVADGSGGFYNTAAVPSTRITYLNCKSMRPYARGWAFFNASANFLLKYCSVTGSLDDAFQTNNNSHDITYYGCRAYSCVADGFTSHAADYNIHHYYCLVYDCGTGFAMVNTSSGLIYNCTTINSTDNARASIYLACTGINATTSSSWTVKNCISVGGINVEVWIGSAVAPSVVMDNNRYHAVSTSEFAVMDDLGSVYISWAAYSSREVNSLNADPLLAVIDSTGNYSIPTNSNCIGTGAIITGIHDQAAPATDFDGNIVRFADRPNIGAYDGRRSLTVTTNYSPTGYQLRGSADETGVPTIIVGADDITVDTSGLTASERVDIKIGNKNPLNVKRKAGHKIKGGSGGGNRYGFGW